MIEFSQQVAPHSSGSSTPPRPWYRLHWLTWLVLALVAYFVMTKQFDIEQSGFSHGGPREIDRWERGAYVLGWPRQIEVGRFSRSWRHTSIDLDYLRLIPLACECVAVLLLTFWLVYRVCETWLIRSRARMTLRGLLLLTTVAAIVMAVARSPSLLEQCEDWINATLRI
jgi:hypothetical protein